ncbi:MAG: hypothetical protein LBN38_03735 [Verrucomicrobiota bacterium]|jgi:hypothetical protein|nr:hypothetical protein [Verrucomicrobiota bacterium]
MAEENDLKPLDISKVKSATSRIDLSRATIPASPSSSGIRIGMNPKKATSHIDISAIPGAAKAQMGLPVEKLIRTVAGSVKNQPTREGPGAMPTAGEDIYKQRTALLDTSKIPLSTAAAQPRTIRIGNRPTVRVGGGGGAATFSPGRSPEGETPSSAGRPTIKLKRPGGASLSVSGGEAPAVSHFSEPVFTIQQEEEAGGVWSVVSLFSMLVIIGLMVVQVMTMNGSVY